MATEIIKTDDPNIVIKRTVVDETINLLEIRDKVSELDKQISSLQLSLSKLAEIDNAELFDIVAEKKTEINDQIAGLEFEKFNLEKYIV